MNTPLEPTPDAHPIRTFIAVTISDAVRGKLTEIQACLKKTGASVGWVPPTNIHFTILFLGAVFESQTVALAAAMDGIARAYLPQILEVKGIGAFGRSSSPRIIWAGLTGNLQPLLALQTEIVTAAKKTAIYPDAKPFKPHITIGRLRSSRQAQELLHAIEPYRDTAFGALEIKSVRLMKSDLTSQGPIYTTLHESRLAVISGM